MSLAWSFAEDEVARRSEIRAQLIMTQLTATVMMMSTTDALHYLAGETETKHSGR